MTLQALPLYAKAVLYVMVALIGVHVMQPVTFLLTDRVTPGFIRNCMLDSALSLSTMYSFPAIEAGPACQQVPWLYAGCQVGLVSDI